VTAAEARSTALVPAEVREEADRLLAQVMDETVGPVLRYSPLSGLDLLDSVQAYAAAHLASHARWAAGTVPPLPLYQDRAVMVQRAVCVALAEVGDMVVAAVADARPGDTAVAARASRASRASQRSSAVEVVPS
jgi:hypothetical protein